MEIVRGRPDGQGTQRRGDTFEGEVLADPVLPTTDGVTVNNVFFPPAARTHWHSHDGGQILHVTAGGGYVCAQGEEPRPIGPGDVVWTPPGETHWHGAAADGYLLHLAVSLGTTRWQGPVGDA